MKKFLSDNKTKIKKIIIISIILLIIISIVIFLVIQFSNKGTNVSTDKNISTQVQTTDETSDVVVDKNSPFSWKKEGKLPNEYTIEEYNKLSESEQLQFVNWFESEEEFYEWQYNAEEASREPSPWEKENAKQPNEYTWEEYSNLDKDDQIRFFNWFESVDKFDKWLKSVKKD